jgi:hypothetical protein
MLLAKHGYGRRKGCGNRYNHAIDDFILDYLFREQIRLDTSNDQAYYIPDTSSLDPDQAYYMLSGQTRPETSSMVPMRGTPKPYAFKPHSLNELYDVIRKGCDPDVSKQTVIDHLDGLASDHILEKCVKAGERNKTFYWLPKLKLLFNLPSEINC